MPAERTFNLQLMPSANRPYPNNNIENNGSVVMIGANGAGKTRLGTWIEFNSDHSHRTHRISAQKSLSLPPTVSTVAVESAESILHYGTQGGNYSNKIGSRWGGNPNVFLLNDFQNLLIYLFSYETDKSVKFRRAAKASIPAQIPETKLDIVQRIWERTLPHRELVISGGKIETQVRGNASKIYNAAEMSDGERVVFYLIGQCLAAPPNGVIIIDEPELHLHRSIQSKLWDEVESQRSDCMFVYLTHDLDFAASRVNAKKIWLKSFDGETWDWDVVPESEEISEDVMLSILGSRKPVIFAEGERSSWDYFIFTHLYPNYTVVPAGNCDAVIHATTSFAAMRSLHSLECHGIIDRDFRTDDQIACLRSHNVHALDISEVENLLVVEEVFRAIAGHLRRTADASALFDKYKRIILSDMEGEKERVVSSLAAMEIETLFKSFNNKALGEDGITAALASTLGAINVKAIYEKAATKVDSILTKGDYREAIKIYDNKGIIAKAANVFGMKNDTYQAFVKNLIIDPAVTDVIAGMKLYAPRLP